MSNPIRPRLRPTLSRRTKYIGVMPLSQKKLGREARRGSFDLRKLVGHANFLDTLVENLDALDETEVVSPTDPAEPEISPDCATEEVETRSEDDDSEEWSDESDDEDHSLMRTASGQPFAANDGEPTFSPITSPDEEGDDYFLSKHGEAVIRDKESVQPVPADLVKDKCGKGIDAVVTSKVIELMDGLSPGSDEIHLPDERT